MRAALALACGLGAGMAMAAGGHHAVDDAEILKRGDCEGEGWFTRARGGERLVHSGVQCRVGPVELGAAAEYGRADGASQTGWALELKWAREVADGLSLGVSVGCYGANFHQLPILIGIFLPRLPMDENQNSRGRSDRVSNTRVWRERLTESRFSNLNLEFRDYLRPNRTWDLISGLLL